MPWRYRKLLGTKGIAPRSKNATRGTPGLTTSNKDATSPTCQMWFMTDVFLRSGQYWGCTVPGFTLTNHEPLNVLASCSRMRGERFRVFDVCEAVC